MAESRLNLDLAVPIKKKVKALVPEVKIPKLILGNLDCTAALFRTPSYQHQNIGLQDDSILMAALPDELIVDIYQLLDVRSVLQLTLACKMLGMIANNDQIRKRLYNAKHPDIKISNFNLKELHLVQQQTDLSPLQFSYHSLASRQDGDSFRLFHDSKVKIYNDKPDGMGFEVKR